MCNKTDINKAERRVKQANREALEEFQEDQRRHERKMKKIL
jgi:hypothetical protein